MVNLTIDGKAISVEENTTIMEAAAANGIPIPKLCYLKAVSYTHLDVYKRQSTGRPRCPGASSKELRWPGQ